VLGEVPGEVLAVSGGRHGEDGAAPRAGAAAAGFPRGHGHEAELARHAREVVFERSGEPVGAEEADVVAAADGLKKGLVREGGGAVGDAIGAPGDADVPQERVEHDVGVEEGFAALVEPVAAPLEQEGLEDVGRDLVDREHVASIVFGRARGADAAGHALADLDELVPCLDARRVDAELLEVAPAIGDEGRVDVVWEAPDAALMGVHLNASGDGVVGDGDAGGASLLKAGGKVEEAGVLGGTPEERADFFHRQLDEIGHAPAGPHGGEEAAVDLSVGHDPRLDADAAGGLERGEDVGVCLEMGLGEGPEDEAVARRRGLDEREACEECAHGEQRDRGGRGAEGEPRRPVGACRAAGGHVCAPTARPLRATTSAYQRPEALTVRFCDSKST